MGIDPNFNSISTFRDALGVAMALADDFAFVNAAMVLGPSGEILDAVMTNGIGQTVDPIVGKITRGGQRRESEQASSKAVLLFSVRPFEPDIVREQDLQIFRNASWRIADVGSRLLDWIETDGDLYRSFAYISCPGEAWPNDPPAERHEVRWQQF